tara:strand:+ start:1651 stop:2031 length:381 start_codon:yes stop_codon:yes gene_type:complete
MKQDLERRCSYYINRLDGHDSVAALDSLMELPDAAVPILMELYRDEPRVDVKRDIVHSIWQHRNLESLDWLLGVLVKEDAEAIWQEALDGIITLKGAYALSQLEVSCPRKSFSISEAIELLEDGYA